MMDFISRRISANTIHVTEIVAGNENSFDCLQSRGLVVLEGIPEKKRYFVFDLTASLSGTRMNAVDSFQKFITVIDHFNELSMSTMRLTANSIKLLKTYCEDLADDWIRLTIRRSGEHVDFPVSVDMEKAVLRFRLKKENLPAYSADRQEAIL